MFGTFPQLLQDQMISYSPGTCMISMFIKQGWWLSTTIKVFVNISLENLPHTWLPWRWNERSDCRFKVKFLSKYCSKYSNFIQISDVFGNYTMSSCGRIDCNNFITCFVSTIYDIGCRKWVRFNADSHVPKVGEDPRFVLPVLPWGILLS